MDVIPGGGLVMRTPPDVHAAAPAPAEATDRMRRTSDLPLRVLTTSVRPRGGIRSRMGRPVRYLPRKGEDSKHRLPACDAGGVRMAEEHSHDEEVHSHPHVHVTHYVKSGQQAEHLTATHGHEHNHAPVSHSHDPHEDQPKEHEREAHIHDHTSPAESPA